MSRKSIFALFMTLVMIGAFGFPILSVLGQSQQENSKSAKEQNRAAAAKLRQIVERYREDDPQRSANKGEAKATGALLQKQERPAWVQEAFNQSLRQVQSQNQKYGVQDAASEFRLLEAMKDGRGYVDIRLAQMHNRVEVFGGQFIAHLDERHTMRAISGRIFAEARIDTAPVIDEAQAIETAKAAFDHPGEFAEAPTARLAILPNQLFRSGAKATGATLVYIVKLKLGKVNGPQQTYQIFISAKTGKEVWRFSNLHNEAGTGISLYSGTVTINTTHNPDDGSFTMKDPDRGQSQPFDVTYDSNGERDDKEFRGFDNAWGDQTSETAAVDVHFGVEQSWNYFSDRQARNGADGYGTAINSYVHYRSNPTMSWNNASGGENQLFFGDGDGTQYSPNVTLDIVGHEFTHCVIDGIFPASEQAGGNTGMIYSGESGAVEESFADIFGTAIGFYSGVDINYQHAEGIVIPGAGGQMRRDLANPQSLGDPDHFSNYVNTTSDNGGVHTNSSIMNHAFYLMAKGGTNLTSNLYVPAIDADDEDLSRRLAEDLFYIALARWLTPTATFKDVAQATTYVAAEYYNRDVAAAVESAWVAVGVLTEAERYYSKPHMPNLDRGRIVLYESGTGFGETGKLNYQDGTYQNLRNYSSFATGWTHIVGMGGPIFYFDAATGYAAVGEIDSDGNHRTTNTFRFKYLGRRPVYTQVVWLGGFDIYFYERQTGNDMFIRLTPNGYQALSGSYTPGSGWTHIVNAQGHVLFYRRDTGSAMLITGRQKKYYTFAPFWSHIVDGGMRGTGEQTGILFYNATTGFYVVGDIDTEGNFTTRYSNRWSYTFMRTGWSQIVKVQEGLFFYDSQYGDTMTGYLLTASESNRFGKEPFQIVPGSTGYVPSLRPYRIVASGMTQ